MFDTIKTRWANVATTNSAGLSLSAVLRRVLSLGRRSGVNGSLQHLGTLPLTPQCSLALVRIQKETLVLGITSNNVTLLSKNRDENRRGSANSVGALAKNGLAASRLRSAKKGKKQRSGVGEL